MDNGYNLSFSTLEASPDTVRELLNQNDVEAVITRHWNILSQESRAGEHIHVSCRNGEIRYISPHGEPLHIPQDGAYLQYEMSEDDEPIEFSEGENGRLRIELGD